MSNAQYPIPVANHRIMDLSSGQTSPIDCIEAKLPHGSSGVKSTDPSDLTTCPTTWGPDDPDNPMNWPQRRKIAIMSAVCLMRFTTPLASSMMAPALTQIGHEFHETNSLLLTSTVSIYVIGFAIGPLLMAPLSEVYGRTAVYHFGNVLFTIFTACCGISPNTASLVVFRLLAGLVGGVPLTNGGGTIADMVPVKERGMFMSVLSFSMLIAPVVGPMTGGFLAQGLGWRWIFWLLTIMSGFMTIFGFIFLRETYSPVLLSRKEKRLWHEAGQAPLPMSSRRSLTPILTRAVERPIRLLFTGPITSAASLYSAVMYGVTYLLFATLGTIFQSIYEWNEGISGLSYLAFGIGCVLGSLIVGRYSDRIHARLSEQHGKAKPEFRFILLFPCSLTFPIGLLIYGWTAQYNIHWIVPLFGTLLIGFGSVSTQTSMQTYIVDAFSNYAASALAANNLIRSLAGGLIPLGGLDMYHTMGMGWGNTLLAFLSIMVGLIPLTLYKYGEGWRSKYQYSLP